MAHLVDTTVLIGMLRGDRSVHDAPAALLKEAPLRCSVVSIAEVYAGMRPPEEARTRALLASLIAYDVTSGIAERAGRISAAGRARGKTVLLPDLLIASTAIEHGLSLVTTNAKDFRGVQGLRVVSAV